MWGIMKKSYYLKYGTDREKGEVRSLFAKKWDIEFSENESDYFGIYFLYEGLYADRLSIMDNFISSHHQWLEEEYKDFKSLVKVAIVSGRNADKLSRLKFMKNVISQIGGMHLISEECVETTQGK